MIVYIDYVDGFFENMVWCKRKDGTPILLEIEDYQDLASLVGKVVSVGVAPDGLSTFDPCVLDTVPEWAQRWKAR
jgi:hypothetical protein